MNDPLDQARQYAEQYEHHINYDHFVGPIERRHRWEDTAYKQAMMAASIAQVERLDCILAALDPTNTAEKVTALQTELTSLQRYVDQLHSTRKTAAAAWDEIEQLAFGD